MSVMIDVILTSIPDTSCSIWWMYIPI